MFRSKNLSRMAACIVMTSVAFVVTTRAEAGDGRRVTARKSNTGVNRNPDLVEAGNTTRLQHASDFLDKLFNNSAELEATSVEFKADFHFGVDQWFNHRVEAKITNIDTSWSGLTRTWQIYSFPPAGQTWGIYLVDQGFISPLEPGSSQNIKRSLASTVNFDASYVLILSAGDANPSNDIAIDQP
jgi:hypothetical protein